MRAAPDAGASRGLPDPGGARAFWAAALWTGLWAGTVVVALAMRPLLPIDETRYAAVAWEMWLGGDSLVPRLNGETYSHKPPVLFWLITAGWWVFGVSELWLRLVAPLSGLASLFATYALARLLWPADAKAARLAPIVVLGSLLFAVTMTVAMFDTLVTPVRARGADGDSAGPAALGAGRLADRGAGHGGGRAHQGSRHPRLHAAGGAARSVVVR